MRSKDIKAARKQEWRAGSAANTASNVAVPAEEIGRPLAEVFLAEAFQYTADPYDQPYWGWPVGCYTEDGLGEDLPTYWPNKQGELVRVVCTDCQRKCKMCDCEREWQAREWCGDWQ